MSSDRFTPTHVGNTRPPIAVHPHARGNTIGALRRFTPTHVGNTMVSSGDDCRFTPTHVGNTQGTACTRFTPTHVGNTLENHAEFGRSRPAALRFFFR